MKVAVKKVDALKRELRFEIPKDRVSQKLEEVYTELTKVAKIKGFRPGKAPRHLIEAEHGPLAREEAIKKLIPEAYEEGLKQENIAPIDYPEIHDVEFKDGQVTFTAHVDIKPEIHIKNYKGIKVTRKSSKVTEEEMEKALEFFQKSQGKDKEIKVDDAFVKGLGYPTLESFKESLTRQMESDKDRQNRIDVENQLVDELLKEAKFALPQTVVKRQMDHRLEELKERLKSQGMSDEDIQKKEEEFRKELQPSVEKDVRVFLVFDKIRELENIQVGERENLPHKVMELLMKEAQWQEEKK